jgi:hypothetical protein
MCCSVDEPQKPASEGSPVSLSSAADTPCALNCEPVMAVAFTAPRFAEEMRYENISIASSHMFNIVSDKKAIGNIIDQI